SEGVDCVRLAASVRRVELIRALRQRDSTEETIMIKKAPIPLIAFCFLAMIFAEVALAQKPVAVAGNWVVTVKMPNGNVTQQWTLRQTGNNVNGTVKTPKGDVAIKGEVVSGVFLRVSFKDGDVEHLVRATADKESMDGSVTIGRAEYLWSAKRSQ